MAQQLRVRRNRDIILTKLTQLQALAASSTSEPSSPSLPSSPVSSPVSSPSSSPRAFKTGLRARTRTTSSSNESVGAPSDSASTAASTSSRAERQLEEATCRFQLKALDELSASLKQAMNAVVVTNETKPFEILGVNAQAAVTSSILSIGMTYYAFLLSRIGTAVNNPLLTKLSHA